VGLAGAPKPAKRRQKKPSCQSSTFCRLSSLTPGQSFFATNFANRASCPSMCDGITEISPCNLEPG